MTKKTQKTKGTSTPELSALADLLEYAWLTALELEQPFLAHLIQMAANESRSASDTQRVSSQASGNPPTLSGLT